MKKKLKKRTDLSGLVRSFFGWPACNGDGPSLDLQHTGACPAHPKKIYLSQVIKRSRVVGLVLLLALLAFSCSKKSPTSVTPPDVQANYYPMTKVAPIFMPTPPPARGREFATVPGIK